MSRDPIAYKVLTGEQLATLESGSFAGAQGATAAADLAEREERQWLDAILGNGEPLVKPREALVVTQILEAVYASARSGREVTF